jgi:hypothetical protein
VASDRPMLAVLPRFSRCWPRVHPEFTRCNAERRAFYIDERLFPRVSGSSPKYAANRLCEVGYNPRFQVTGIRAISAGRIRSLGLPLRGLRWPTDNSRMVDR